METSRKPLKIRRTQGVKNGNVCRVQLLALIILGFSFLGPICQYHSSISDPDGIVTKKLKEDQKVAFPKPRPTRSSWIDHPLIINEISRGDNRFSSDQNSMELVAANFPWIDFISVMESLVLTLFVTGSYIIRLYVVGINKSLFRWLIFVLVCGIVSMFVVLSGDTIAIGVYHYTKTNIMTFWNRSIVDVRETDDKSGMGRIDEYFMHPYTGGIFAPFYFERQFRYPGEDVTMKCNYEFIGSKEVEPIMVSSWWYKNGHPIETDDRMFVNVSIQGNASYSFAGLQAFVVRNELTINTVDADDYGRYSCKYNRPIPLIIKPAAFQTSSSNKVKIQNMPPMSSTRNCDCKPSPVYTQTSTEPYEIECFKEIDLLRRLPTESPLYVDVTIGGLFAMTLVYITATDPHDVSVDLSLYDNVKTECCSPFVKFYWIMFGGGALVDLPFNRFLWGNHGVAFRRWFCICKNTPLNQTTTIYRNIYNSTLRRVEYQEINHPLTVVLRLADNNSMTFLDSLHFCDGNAPWYSLCGFLDILLDNQYYTVYAIDVFFGILSIIVLLSLYYVVRLLKTQFLKPLRRICFHLCSVHPSNFEAVNGPKVKFCGRKRRRVSRNHVQQGREIDIYFSYCQDNLFDRTLAQHFKSIMQQQGLSVFDPNEDILPGELTLHQSSAAIHKSSRFVVFMSNAYNDDDIKRVEFDAINDDIKSQETNPKDRLLIFREESCNVIGLHRVPCIHLPETLPRLNPFDQTHEEIALDQIYENRFREWEVLTRPLGLEIPENRGLWKEANALGFTWKSVLISLSLLLLASRSSFFSELYRGEQV